MHTTFMNSENSKTPDTHRLLLILSEKTNSKGSGKYVALSSLSICYKWKNMKKLYKYNKCKISAPTWKDKFELADRSYSISNIQNNFVYVYVICIC